MKIWCDEKSITIRCSQWCKKPYISDECVFRLATTFCNIQKKKPLFCIDVYISNSFYFICLFTLFMCLVFGSVIYEAFVSSVFSAVCNPIFIWRKERSFHSNSFASVVSSFVRMYIWWWSFCWFPFVVMCVWVCFGRCSFTYCMMHDGWWTFMNIRKYLLFFLSERARAQS